MKRIQALPINVANQIAAGEVIERPASVVKELLENSLDAGADAIHIEIGSSGCALIRVSDNGIGIVSEDLPLAVAPHATSKIIQLSDLYAMTSMGFRGEALASIASISRLSILSKPDCQEYATLLSMDTGELVLKSCARTRGTTIEVRDLFFNAPVRKKFLKTEYREFQFIEMIVKRFALSEPSVTLTMKHNGKQVLNLPAAICEKTRLARIKSLFGKTFVEQSIYLDTQRADLHLQGWISNINMQRSQQDKQWIYLNRRIVKDKLLQHAVKQAYEGILHAGRYPVCVLYLMVPPGEVDVNVHPTKHEVRFHQPRLVHDLITSQITCALQNNQPDTQAQVNQQVHSPKFAESYSLADVSNLRTSFTNSQWVNLNKQFVILFANHRSAEPYLVDIAMLQRARFDAWLKDQKLPLTSRPLLVPIMYPIDKSNLPLMEKFQTLLQQFGIEYDLFGENNLKINRIPINMPTLNIQQLMCCLLNIQPDISAVASALVNCQIIDAFNIGSEEQHALIDYWEQIMQENNHTSMSAHLDVTRCRSLI